ncbi:MULTISPECIES: acyl-CoA dehydrogenase family protein [unclassified Sphingopyxis]|uniref:acyl-CoA dehydrogenase family protein n=1 Tax=unclassified Sphingopyxis TaxID=2614943 RepID=UPI0028617213|nr:MULTISPECIES: acyl-CoA dehydrogenase family protein [unclassified Sphingopyxis]MDR7059862.1 alkylation response protein AidB-like acyl-CoA dehydrogenase [Sphingopyxis sp. BE235]MDR7180626.1 alkylation response protein AidB-like acyl-CoA dehydrogenase [Sphingopyxis sp. BE249]
MSAAHDMLCNTARAVFAEAATAGIAPVEEAGFGLLLVPEEDGGFGGDWGDANAVLQIAGVVVPDLPVAELIAGEAYQPAATVSLMAGAMGQALALSIEHVNTRQQFGRPLGKFQAVQQSLAVMACEVRAVEAAAAALATRLDAMSLDPSAADFEIAAAKLRANRAVGVVTAIAHQVHGAIGFTEEYDLHRVTVPLMRWRGAHGNDAYWAARLGRQVATFGGRGLWEAMTARGA